MANTNEKADVSEGLNEFIQKNRKTIFVLAGFIVILFAGFVVTLSIMDVLRKKAIAAVEELNDRYEALRFSIAEEQSAGDVEALLADLSGFADANSGYAGGRAWAIIAGIYSDKKDWPSAENAWLSAAQSAVKTYLAPVAWFNAGAAAEEQGKTAEAIERYAKSLTFQSAFPAASRAQFAIGRLREALGEKAAALEAYRELIAKWPYDSVWVNLAQSRIIALE